jgi:hypothetical protein
VRSPTMAARRHIYRTQVTDCYSKDDAASRLRPARASGPAAALDRGLSPRGTCEPSENGEDGGVTEKRNAEEHQAENPQHPAVSSVTRCRRESGQRGAAFRATRTRRSSVVSAGWTFVPDWAALEREHQTNQPRGDKGQMKHTQDWIDNHARCASDACETQNCSIGLTDGAQLRTAGDDGPPHQE